MEEGAGKRCSECAEAPAEAEGDCRDHHSPFAGLFATQYKRCQGGTESAKRDRLRDVVLWGEGGGGGGGGACLNHMSSAAHLCLSAVMDNEDDSVSVVYAITVISKVVVTLISSSSSA